MEYNSFYGGRRGASFIIAENYKSEQEMITAFSQGGQYKTVNYDEYVIIDTENKNDITNGRIYRRGYDYTNEWGGAEYVGQIVGPAGLGPHAEVIEKSEVKKKYDESEASGDQLDYRYGQGTMDTTTNDLVPGAKGEVNNRTFDDETDKIHWEYFSLRDAQQLESTCYIGFQVPYTVFDFFTEAVDPYKDGNYADMTAVIRQPISDEHPFYEQWKIQIPKGVKGDLIDNFRLYTPEQDETLPDFGGVEHTLGAGRTVLIYDYWWYDNKQDGEKKTLYFGEYEVIDDILVENDGTVIVKYKSNREDTVLNKRIQWIDQVTLTEQGVLTVDFNNGAAPYVTNLKWVRNLSLATDGTVTVIFNDESSESLAQKIKWATGVEMDEHGVITTTWNDNTTSQYSEAVKWITDVDLEDNGNLSVTYNDDEGPQYINTIKWLIGSEYSADDGTVTFTYNTGATEAYTYKYIKQVELTEEGDFSVIDNTDEPYLITQIIYPKYVNFDNGHTLIITGNDRQTEFLNVELKWVNDIVITNDKFELIYNNGETQILENLLLNQIDETVIPVTGDYAYHLLIYYTAVEKRGSIEYDNRTGWQDLGLVKDYNGIMIGYNIDSSDKRDLDDPTNAISYLNGKYPAGIEEGYSAGKVVTIGANDEEKRLYAFDYEKREWFYLGNPSGAKDIRSVIIGSEGDPLIVEAAQEMPTGSLWFILEGDE